MTPPFPNRCSSVRIAEYLVTVAFRSRVIQEVVVDVMEVELRGCGVRVRSASHRDRAAVVLQAVRRFDGDWCAGLALIVTGIVTAALDHEALDDTMKYEAIVVAVVRILNKIGDGFRRLRGVEFEFDRAERGVNADAGNVGDRKSTRLNSSH